MDNRRKVVLSVYIHTHRDQILVWCHVAFIARWTESHQIGRMCKRGTDKTWRTSDVRVVTVNKLLSPCKARGE